MTNAASYCQLLAVVFFTAQRFVGGFYIDMTSSAAGWAAVPWLIRPAGEYPYGLSW